MDRGSSLPEFAVGGAWLAEYTMAALGAAVVVFDGHARVIARNPTTVNPFGIPGLHLVGRRLDDGALALLRSDGVPMTASDDPVRAVLTHGEPVMGVVIGSRDSAGRIRWSSLNLLPILGPDRAPRAVLASVIDVTDTFEARNSIADWQLAANALLRQSISADLVVDRDGTLLEWNERALELIGRSEVGVIGCNLRQICDIDLEWVWEELQQADDSGFDGITSVLRRSDEIPVVGRFGLMTWPGIGEVIVIRLLERSRVVGEWPCGEMVQSRVFEQADVPLLMVSRGGVVVAANHRATGFLGRPAPDLVGQDLCDLVVGFSVGDVTRRAAESEVTAGSAMAGHYMVRTGAGDVGARVLVTAMGNTDSRPDCVMIQLTESIGELHTDVPDWPGRSPSQV